MHKYLLYFLIIFLSACTETTNNDTNELYEADTTPLIAEEPEKPADLSGCYIRVTGQDTLWLRLNQNEDEITGTMEFDNFEKDSSKGIIKGKKLEDGVIFVFYDFHAEGTNSVREIYFKPGNKKLRMATGDMDVKGDTSYFLNAPNLFYSQSDALDLVDCALMNNR